MECAAAEAGGPAYSGPDQPDGLAVEPEPPSKQHARGEAPGRSRSAFQKGIAIVFFSRPFSFVAMPAGSMAPQVYGSSYKAFDDNLFSGPDFIIPPFVGLELEGEPGSIIQNWIAEMEDSARLTLKGLQLLNVRTFRTPGLLRSNTSLIIDESDGSGSGYFISEVVAVRNSRLNFDLSSRWGLGDDHFANAHVVGEEGLSVFSTVLNSTRLFAKGNTSLDNCTATGNYRVQISGMPSHAGLINRAVTPTMMVRNSHLAHCRGTCLTIREADNASVLLQGSTVQTALDVHSVDGLRLDVRDVTVLEMQSTFLEFARKPSQEPG